MDFLDPKYQHRHRIQLIFGYVCVAIAIVFATRLLLYQAHGYGLSKGQVVQNGLLFVSSHPAGAQIYLNGVPNSSLTNARLSLVSGNYTLKVTRSGYRDWERSVSVMGGAIERFDYPFLFPKKLVTTPIGGGYAAAPGVVTQSPDKRWLLVEQPGSDLVFDEYDLKSPTTPPVVLTIPSTVYTASTTGSWKVIEWSSDNTHLLLQHTYGDSTEFVMVDRTDAAKAVDLNVALGLNPARVNLLDGKYDHYYIYNAAAQTVRTTSLSDPTPQPLLDHVLDYKTYGNNVVLYVSSVSSTPDKVSIDLYQDGKSYALRKAAAGTSYLLDVTQYSGSWYVAVGASSEGKVYIYKNPVTLLNSPLGAIRPIYVLQNPKPTYLSFSANAQFVMAESGTQFVVFDVKNDAGYRYNTKLPLDAPQQHATWMDGDRLMYVSGGKLVVFDYDDQNAQTLMPANPNYTPLFNATYSFVDALTTPQADGHVDLTTTALLTPADQ